MSVEPKSLFDLETLAQAPESMDPADRRKLLTSAEGLLNSAGVFEPRRDPITPGSGAPVDHAVEGFAAVSKRTFNKFPS